MKIPLSTPTVVPVSMEDIRDTYDPGLSRHWFDPSSMRWFRCRLPQSGVSGPGGVYFVSSEKGPRETSPRAYTVRRLEGPGKIENVGEFCGYASRSSANRAALRAAKG
jgi:hypothetical protein